jgi:hypothetical protein
LREGLPNIKDQKKHTLKVNPLGMSCIFEEVG